MVHFEPISVDCPNEITLLSCAFVNTIVEMNFTALAGSLSATRSFASFWGPMQFIVVIKLGVLVVFLEELLFMR